MQVLNLRQVFSVFLLFNNLKMKVKMKNLLLMLTLLFVLFSCKNQETTNAENEKLVRQFFSHFNNHAWDKMADMYGENAEFKDPTLGKGIVKQSRGEIIKKYSDLHQIFPNLNDEITNLYPSGKNHIVVEFISRGTAQDSSKFELPICTIFTVEGGFITKDFTYFDNFKE
jgi:ketosteroid isomerase-like protein